MSKSPDLSAFPIPRKGNARPINNSDPSERSDKTLLGNGEGEHTSSTVVAEPNRETPKKHVSRPEPTSTRHSLEPPIVQQAPSAIVSGQVVATTVKLDEDRYLRLVSAGQPGPGRLKRRTIQEMMVEAIDEWFARRRL